MNFLSKLIADFPQFSFKPGVKFSFRPPKTIFYPKNLANSENLSTPEKLNPDLLLLHELGHALSGHFSFNTCAGRVRMEVEAWQKARNLAKTYQIPFDEILVETELDSYRSWLHQKSKCPSCSLTRFETKDGIWHCPRCDFFKKHS